MVGGQPWRADIVFRSAFEGIVEEIDSTASETDESVSESSSSGISPSSSDSSSSSSEMCFLAEAVARVGRASFAVGAEDGK